MPQPKYSSQYPDVKQVFDAALAQGGCRYTLKEGAGKATHWRQRAYTFKRRLANELESEALAAGVPYRGTPYDGIRMTIDPADRNTVIIEVYTAERTGTITALDGSKPVKVDPALDAALAFRDSLKDIKL